MNIFEQYNKHEIEWKKSVREVSKFILDRLDKTDFYEFISGEDVDEVKQEHWQLDLDKLMDKVTKRMGHAINQGELLNESFSYIIGQREEFQLAPSKKLDYFCNNIEVNLKK